MKILRKHCSDRMVRQLLTVHVQWSSEVNPTQIVSEQRMVFEWLSTVDAAECHHTARAKHERGTGDWLLDSEDFDLWLTGTREVIWLYGIPGSGKTGMSVQLRQVILDRVLTLPVHCSTIIDHVQKICKNSEKPVSFCIYYYFDFKDRRRQTFDGFIRSALAQVCQQSTTFPREVMNPVSYTHLTLPTIFSV